MNQSERGVSESFLCSTPVGRAIEDAAGTRFLGQAITIAFAAERERLEADEYVTSPFILIRDLAETFKCNWGRYDKKFSLPELHAGLVEFGIQKLNILRVAIPPEHFGYTLTAMKDILVAFSHKTAADNGIIYMRRQDRNAIMRGIDLGWEKTIQKHPLKQ